MKAKHHIIVGLITFASILTVIAFVVLPIANSIYEAQAGIPLNTPYRWKFLLVSAGIYQTGQTSTITFSIMRNSDHYWLDFDDNTFKESGHTSISTNPSEDTSNSTGKYYYHDWTLPSSETTPEIYTGSWESTGSNKARDAIDISYDRITFYFGQ